MGLSMLTFKREMELELPLQQVEELLNISDNGYFLSTKVRPQVYWLSQKIPIYFRGRLGTETTLRCELEVNEKGTLLKITSNWSFAFYLSIIIGIVAIGASFKYSEALLVVVVSMVVFVWATFLGQWNNKYLYIQVRKYLDGRTVDYY